MTSILAASTSVAVNSFRCLFARSLPRSFSTTTTSTTTQQPPKFLGGMNRNGHLNPKFKNPRKRASKLFAELNAEAVAKSKARNDPVFKTPFRVGDAIEVEMVSMGGGIRSKVLDKHRGVVLGIINRGLGSSFYLRDVVFGEPVERKIPLHSPMLKSIKVLERNFVHKGKKRVKRAKLYYLRDRPPNETRVTKW